MKTKGKRPEGIVFTNADPRYAGKLDDPHGGDATMLMQQVREVMTVNQKMTDESRWIWLTLEQMGFPLQSEFANENHIEAGISKQCNDQCTDQTALLLAPIITDFIRNTERELYDKKPEDALEILIFGMEQRRRHQNAIQQVEHQSTSTRKCVQQEWSSTGETADAVGSTFQTSGR